MNTDHISFRSTDAFFGPGVLLETVKRKRKRADVPRRVDNPGSPCSCAPWRGFFGSRRRCARARIFIYPTPPLNVLGALLAGRPGGARLNPRSVREQNSLSPLERARRFPLGQCTSRLRECKAPVWGKCHYSRLLHTAAPLAVLHIRS